MADADLTANLDASGFERGTEVIGRSVGELLSTVQRLQGIGEEPIGAGLADVLLDLPEIAQEAMDGVNRSLARIGTGGGGKSTLDALKAQFKGLEEAADRVLSGIGSNAKVELFPGGEAGLRRMVAGVIDEYAAGIRRANSELLGAGRVTPAQARGTETYLGNAEGRNDARLFGANEEASRRYNEQLDKSTRATASRTQAETGLTESARRLKAAQDAESEELEARRFLGRIGATNQQPSPFRESEQPQQSPPRPAAPPATSPFAPQPTATPPASPRPAEPPVAVPFSDPQSAPVSPPRPGPVSTDPFRPAEQQLQQAAQETNTAARALTQSAEKITLYRGDQGESRRASTNNPAGRFFTHSLDEAQQYAGSDGQILSVEVTRKQAENAARRATEAESGSESAYLVPANVARKARPWDGANPTDVSVFSGMDAEALQAQLAQARAARAARPVEAEPASDGIRIPTSAELEQRREQERAAQPEGRSLDLEGMLERYTQQHGWPSYVREPSRRALTEGAPVEDPEIKTLVDFVRNGETTTRPLYRGVSGEYAKHLAENAEPGTTLPLGVSSFSQNLLSALGFAGGEHGALISAQPGARAGEIGNSHFEGEEEFLSGGKFEVIAKEFDEELGKWFIEIRASAEQFAEKAEHPLGNPSGGSGLEQNLNHALDQVGGSGLMPHERRVEQEPDNPQRRSTDVRLEQNLAHALDEVAGSGLMPHERPTSAITPEIAAQTDARNRALAEQAVQDALRPAAPYGFDHPDRVPEGVRDYGKTETGSESAVESRTLSDPPLNPEEEFKLRGLRRRWQNSNLGESLGVGGNGFGTQGNGPVRDAFSSLLSGGDAPEQARLLYRGIQQSAPTQQELYRGLHGDYAKEMAGLTPGSEFTLPIGGFSESQFRAEEFTRHGAPPGEAEASTVLHLQPGARALGPQGDASDINNGEFSFSAESEHLTSGHFRVMRTEWDEEEEVTRVYVEALKEQIPALNELAEQRRLAAEKSAAEPANERRPAPIPTFSDAETTPLTSRPTTIPVDPFTGEQRVVDDLVQTTYNFKQAAEETQRAASAQEAFVGGHVPGGTVPPNGPGGPGGGGGTGSGGDEPRTWALSEMSEQEMADAAKTRARGIAQIANTSNFVVPEWDASVRYNPGQKATEDAPAVDPHWEEIANPISKLILGNLAKPGTLGGAAEGVLGDERGAAFRPVSKLFDPNETSQSKYALAQRIQESRQPHGGYDSSYSENVQPDFTPVKNSTTLFRDLNDQLVKVTRDLASYNVTNADQIAADKARTEEDLRRVELSRGEAIRQGLPGFEQISDKGNFYNTPQGAPAILRSDGRASIALNNREQMGADKAIEDEKRAAEEKATADRMYAQALKGSRLNNIAVNNPADEMRDLGNGYKQLGEVLYKQVGEGMRVVEGQRELYEASMGLAKKLEAQGRSQVDQGIWKSFLGGAFGHGFESNQQFKPADALKNLAGTAGVLARYGGEGRLLFGAMDGVKESVNQFSEYQKAMIDLRAAQDALTESGVSAKNARVDLNEATDIGAKYGLDELASMAAGTAGLKAYSEELKNGKSAADIFNQSVQAAGVAAVLTGKSAGEMFPTQTAITNEFQLGVAGLPRVNDAAANAARHFNAPMDRILTGMQESGDLANIAGFDPERQAATVGAVDEYTGKDSGPQIARELSQGGSARFRTAVAQLGVQFDAGDIGGTLAKAGEAYKNFDGAQKQAFATMLGGSRTAETVIALLEQQSKIAETTADSYKNQGRAIEEAAAKQKTFGGEMNQLHTLLTNLATDLGKIGLVSFFGDVLVVAKPVIGAFDDLAKLLDVIPSQLKQVLVGLAAVRGLSALGGGAGILGATAGTVGRRAQVGSALTNARAGAGRIYGGTVGRARPGGSAQSKTTKEHTEDVVKDSAATKEHTNAVIGDTTAAKGEAEAKAAETDAAKANADADLVAADAAKKKADADLVGADASRRRTVADDTAGLGGGLAGLSRADKLANKIPGVNGGVGGGGLLGAGLVAMIGAEVIKGTYEKVSGILNARSAADNAVNGGVSIDPEANRKAAGDANAAAVAAEQARSGVVGHVLDWVSGGSNNEIAGAKDAATIRNDLATQLDKDAQQGTQNGQLMSLDISSPEALDNSLKALDATGASAKEGVDALVNAMDNLAASGRGSAGRLNQTDITQISHVGGAAAANSINQGIGLASDLFGHAQFATGHIAADDVNTFTWGNNTGSHGAREKSYQHDVGVVAKSKADITTAADKAVNDYLTQNPGYDPAKDQGKLVDFIAAAIVAVPGMESVDPRTVHAIAVDVASQVRGAASDKVAPQNATDATVQDAFNQSLSRAAAEGPLQGARVEAGEVDPAHPNDSGATADARYQLDVAKHQLNNAMTTMGPDGKRLATDAEIADDKAKVDQLQQKFNQSIASDLQDQLKINQANRALTDTLGRGQDAIDALKQQIAQELTTDPRQAKIDTAVLQEQQKQLAQDTTQTQAAGITVGINDAQTGASIAGAQPSFDPRDVLGNAQRQESGDQQIFNQIDAAEKGMPQHSQAWIDAFKKVQADKTEIANDENDIANAALDAATRPGDAMDAARKAVEKAKNTLKTKRPGSAEYGTAEAVVRQSEYDEGQKAADDQNARNAAAITPGNTVQAAGKAIGDATNKLNADAKDSTQYFIDLAALKAAQYQFAQTMVGLANAEVTAHVFPGDAVGAAEAQVTTLSNQLAAEHDPAKWWEEWGQLQQAKVALSHAEIDAASVAATLQSDTTNPVAMAKIAADKARQTYAADAANKNLTGSARTRVLNADVLSERQTQNAQESAAFSQWLSDTQINMELGRTSFATYLQLLESRDAMLKKERAAMKVGSDGYRQMTDQINQTEQTLHSAMSQLSGQFNIGQDIKLPTVYEVRRSLGTAAGGTGYNDNRTVSIVINGVGSTQEVVQIVKQQLGTQATVTRGPTTTRKV